MSLDAVNGRLKEGPFMQACPHCSTEYDVPAGRVLIWEWPEESPRARHRAWGANDSDSRVLHECADGVPLEPVTPLEAVARLSLENAQLREALHDQWLENHWEHCGDEWPHPSSRAVPCGWPLPSVLDPSCPMDRVDT